MPKITKSSFQKKLSEVTKQQTVTRIKISSKGTEYSVDEIPTLQVYFAGTSPDEANGKYRYSIIDPKNELEYSITAPNKVNATFGCILQFANVRGGLLENGVWFSADEVALVKQNA